MMVGVYISDEQLISLLKMRQKKFIRENVGNYDEIEKKGTNHYLPSIIKDDYTPMSGEKFLYKEYGTPVSEEVYRRYKMFDDIIKVISEDKSSIGRELYENLSEGTS